MITKEMEERFKANLVDINELFLGILNFLYLYENDKNYRKCNSNNKPNRIDHFMVHIAVKKGCFTQKLCGNTRKNICQNS